MNPGRVAKGNAGGAFGGAAISGADLWELVGRAALGTGAATSTVRRRPAVPDRDP